MRFRLYTHYPAAAAAAHDSLAAAATVSYVGLHTNPIGTHDIVCCHYGIILSNIEIERKPLPNNPSGNDHHGLR